MPLDEQLGQFFIQMRAAAGIPPTMVAARLGTDQQTLVALERGDLAALPAEAEIARIVTTYGRMVGIDPSIALERILSSRGPIAQPASQARAAQPVSHPAAVSSGGWIAPAPNGPGLSRASDRFTQMPRSEANAPRPSAPPSPPMDAASGSRAFRDSLPPIPVAMPFQQSESALHPVPPPQTTVSERRYAPQPAPAVSTRSNAADHPYIGHSGVAPARSHQAAPHGPSVRMSTLPPTARQVVNAAGVTRLSPINPLQPPERTQRATGAPSDTAGHADGPQMEVGATPSRRPLRTALKYVTAPMLLIGGLWYTVQNPSSVHAAISRLPEPIPRIAQAGMDIVLINTAPTKDGLRIIATRDPRSRKADKLPVRREAAK